MDPALGTVSVDASRVKQILYNYLSNSIKFTPEGGKVVVRVSIEGPALFRIDVEDTGVGISSEDLSKLFIEFHQLDATAAKKYQGTGLGLALTKRLVEAHGGRVTARSLLGEGSTFSAVLPREMTITPPESTGDSPARSDSSRRTRDPANRTILVIDDDVTALKIAAATLQASGYLPVPAASASEGLRAAAEREPALVVLDLLMPGMDGFEFISELRRTEAGRDVPIIVWTVKDLDAAELRRLRSEAVAVLSRRGGETAALVDEIRKRVPTE